MRNAAFTRVMIADISDSSEAFGVYVDEYERVAVIRHPKDWDGDLDDPAIEITEASSEEEAKELAIDAALKHSGYNTETVH